MVEFITNIKPVNEEPTRIRRGKIEEEIIEGDMSK